MVAMKLHPSAIRNNVELQVRGDKGWRVKWSLCPVYCSFYLFFGKDVKISIENQFVELTFSYGKIWQDSMLESQIPFISSRSGIPFQYALMWAGNGVPTPTIVEESRAEETTPETSNIPCSSGGSSNEMLADDLDKDHPHSA
ncbi:hypothetical protein V6N13_039620 [Hibiscus sabdariffa]